MPVVPAVCTVYLTQYEAKSLNASLMFFPSPLSFFPISLSQQVRCNHWQAWRNVIQNEDYQLAGMQPKEVGGSNATSSDATTPKAASSSSSSSSSDATASNATLF
jgi:hypothetical protein